MKFGKRFNKGGHNQKRKGFQHHKPKPPRAQQRQEREEKKENKKRAREEKLISKYESDSDESLNASDFDDSDSDDMAVDDSVQDSDVEVESDESDNTENAKDRDDQDNNGDDASSSDNDIGDGAEDDEDDDDENDDEEEESEQPASKRRKIEMNKVIGGKTAMEADDNPDEQQESDEMSLSIDSFDSLSELNVNQVLISALKQAFSDIHSLTSIQKRSLPLTLISEPNVGRKDFILQAKTGSGKTLAFLIPALEKILNCKDTAKAQQVLIVSPTRELAIQISEAVQRICLFTDKIADLSIALCVGGSDESNTASEQVQQLGTAQIIVATPGRLADLMQSSAFSNQLANIHTVVVDEADRFLSQDLLLQLAIIMEQVQSATRKYQSILTSATFPSTKEMNTLFDIVLTNNQFHHITEEESSGHIPKDLTQQYLKVKLEQKLATLTQLIMDNSDKKIIVFAATKRSVQYYTIVLDYLLPGIDILELHGDIPQKIRTQTYFSFMNLKKGVLICTDVAARGLDFADIDLVIQYGVPDSVETYTHRIGRTARAGKTGKAVLFIVEKLEEPLLKVYQTKRTQIKIEPMELLDQTKVHAFQQELSQFVQNDKELRELGALVVKVEKYCFNVSIRRMRGMKNQVFVPVSFGIGVGLSKNFMNYINFNDTQEIKQLQDLYNVITRRTRTTNTNTDQQEPQQLSKRALKKLRDQKIAEEKKRKQMEKMNNKNKNNKSN